MILKLFSSLLNADRNRFLATDQIALIDEFAIMVSASYEFKDEYEIEENVLFDRDLF